MHIRNLIKHEVPLLLNLFKRKKAQYFACFFISKSYFKVPKTIRFKATLDFIMNIPNKKELQQKASNHLSDIDFEDFMKLYKDYAKEPHLFLVNDTNLSSDNPLRLRKNLL